MKQKDLCLLWFPESEIPDQASSLPALGEMFHTAQLTVGRAGLGFLGPSFGDCQQGLFQLQRL